MKTGFKQINSSFHLASLFLIFLLFLLLVIDYVQIINHFCALLEIKQNFFAPKPETWQGVDMHPSQRYIWYPPKFIPTDINCEMFITKKVRAYKYAYGEDSWKYYWDHAMDVNNFCDIFLIFFWHLIVAPMKLYFILSLLSSLTTSDLIQYVKQFIERVIVGGIYIFHFSKKITINSKILLITFGPKFLVVAFLVFVFIFFKYYKLFERAEWFALRSTIFAALVVIALAIYLNFIAFHFH